MIKNKELKISQIAWKMITRRKEWTDLSMIAQWERARWTYDSLVCRNISYLLLENFIDRLGRWASGWREEYRLRDDDTSREIAVVRRCNNFIFMKRRMTLRTILSLSLIIVQNRLIAFALDRLLSIIARQKSRDSARLWNIFR